MGWFAAIAVEPENAKASETASAVAANGRIVFFPRLTTRGSDRCLISILPGELDGVPFYFAKFESLSDVTNPAASGGERCQAHAPASLSILRLH